MRESTLRHHSGGRELGLGLRFQSHRTTTTTAAPFLNQFDPNKKLINLRASSSDEELLQLTNFRTDCRERVRERGSGGDMYTQQICTSSGAEGTSLEGSKTAFFRECEIINLEWRFLDR